MVGPVRDFIDDLADFAGMDADDDLERPERPRELAHVGVQLDAHRARRIYLGVRGLVGLRDVAEPRDLADLLVERHQRVPESEHQDHDDEELAKELPIAPPRIVGVAHLRRFLPIANTRNTNTTTPITATPISGPAKAWATMMPTKNTTAIDAKTSAVRTFAALRSSVVGFAVST